MSDEGGAAWTAADTSLLVRAWAAAAAKSAPKAAGASVVFQHFQQLTAAAGGASGRAEKSVQWRRTLLSNTHAVIATYNARASASAASATTAQSTEQRTPSGAVVASHWFTLSAAERRRYFGEINQKASAQYTPLTEEQFAAISKLQRLVAVGSSSPADEPPAPPTNVLTPRLIKWTTADTSLLVRAWADAAAQPGRKALSARAIARRFEQLSVDGRSGRSLVSVVQKHAHVANMVAVIRVHDAAAGEASDRWFSDSDSERQRFFAATNKVAWMKFVDLTREQFDAVVAIDSSVRDDDREAAPSCELESVADASKSLLVPRAPWSDDDTTRLLRAWATVRVDTNTAEPAGMEVVSAYNRLSGGTGKQASDSAVCLKHYVTHNMHTVICAYNAGVAATEQRRERRTPSWFELSDAERRTFFSSTNMNLTYWYVDLSAEHFQFISDTRTHDGVAAASKTRRHSGKQRRETWTSEHTTLMLRAWQDAVAESRARKPATSAVFRRFVALLSGESGAKKSFTNRFRSLRFAHSVIRIFVKQYTDEYDDKADAERGRDESCTEAALDKWFSMAAVDRRRYFNGANGTSHSFMDLTREQFEILAKIMVRTGVSTSIRSNTRMVGAEKKPRGSKAGATKSKSGHAREEVSIVVMERQGRRDECADSAKAQVALPSKSSNRRERTAAVILDKEEVPASVRRVSESSFVDTDSSSPESRHGDWDENASRYHAYDSASKSATGSKMVEKSRSEPLALVGDVPSGDDAKSSQHRKRQRSETRPAEIFTDIDSPEPPDKRVRTQSGLVETANALEVLLEQTATLRQMLKKAMNASG